MPSTSGRLSRGDPAPAAASDIIRQHSFGGKAEAAADAPSPPIVSLEATSGAVLHSGYVEKRRVDAKLGLGTRRWKRRYLELHPTTLVWIREGKKDTKGYIFVLSLIHI